ncbi:hypothetical protein [Metabacillus fastidiosus]|uniref:hypothetical protein n=1 Tax=Metabacillus fastidiosus TaxID=1458 RepID=UPI003D286CDC
MKRSKRRIRSRKREIENTESLAFCPECVPAGNEENDLFCSPCRCPEQIPQPRFSSPNSNFPPEDLEVLKKCINKANTLLLSLAQEGEIDGNEIDSARLPIFQAGEAAEGEVEINDRALQISLFQLIGQCVEVTIRCNDCEEVMSGIFADSGRDFIILERNYKIHKNLLLIPFEKIIKIEHRQVKEPCERDLRDIDACLRRDITFCFGETVTKSPFLLNLFFGISLSVFLESYIGCFVYMKGEEEIKGYLHEMTNRSVVIIDNGDKRGIDFDELCFIEIEDSN